MKTGQSRIDDSVAYIYTQINQELANHLSMTVRTGNPTTIGKELSLGSRPDGSDDPTYAANTSQRQALRALLLCQRVYYSDLWWTATYAGGATSKLNCLQPGWKATSLQYWGSKSEAQIKDGIRIFATTNRDPTTLVAAASQQPGGTAMPDLKVTRATVPFPGLLSCYGGVMTWLLRSGIVSIRWFARYAGSNEKASLTAAFGVGREIIGENDPFGPNDRFPQVPAGHIVHLFCEGLRWNGHWLVSHGNGNASGCNNDSTDGTNTAYALSCSLANQFRNGYRDAIDGQPGKFWKGKAVVIDPLTIPSII